METILNAFARFMNTWATGVVIGLLLVTGILPAAFLVGRGFKLLDAVVLDD